MSYNKIQSRNSQIPDLSCSEPKPLNGPWNICMQHWGSQYQLQKSATYFLNEPRWTIYHLSTLCCSFLIYKIVKYCTYPHNNKTILNFLWGKITITHVKISPNLAWVRTQEYWIELVFLAEFYNKPWLFCSFIQLITIFVLICSYSHPPQSPL